MPKRETDGRRLDTVQRIQLASYVVVKMSSWWDMWLQRIDGGLKKQEMDMKKHDNDRPIT